MGGFTLIDPKRVIPLLTNMSVDREIGRGPNRGLPARWHLHAYRVEGLAPGAHRLEAVCWQIGAHAPLAQLSVRGGFLLKASGAYDGALTTGRAPWLVAPLAGTRMTDKGESETFGAGSECEVRGASVLDEEPPAGAWEPAAVVRGPVGGRYGIRRPGWLLFPTPLPDMMLRRATPGMFRPGPLPRVVPARSRVEALWDLGDYYCAYPELRVSGGRGARVRWDWAECLVGPDGRKLSRMRYRKCLICGRQAQECSRSRTHTVREMQDAVDLMLNQNLLKEN